MKINPQIVFRKEFDHSAIIFNPDNGESYGLNPTSAFIWECLDSGMELEQIVVEIGKHANHIPDSVSGDIAAFIVVLQQKGYLSA